LIIKTNLLSNYKKWKYTKGINKVKGKKTKKIRLLRLVLARQKKCNCKESLRTALIKTIKSTLFYIDLPNVGVFVIHSLAKPYLKKRWLGKKKTKPLRRESSKMGRKSALHSKDELFLTLLELRLGSLDKYEHSRS